MIMMTTIVIIMFRHKINSIYGNVIREWELFMTGLRIFGLIQNSNQIYIMMMIVNEQTWHCSQCHDLQSIRKENKIIMTIQTEKKQETNDAFENIRNVQDNKNHSNKRFFPFPHRFISWTNWLNWIFRERKGFNQR